ncbi:MAG: hypothetical protein ACKOXB_01870 [Flavobacteriales bacterium]
MKKYKPWLVVAVLILLLKGLELVLDYAFGNHDGELVALRYLQFFVLGFFVFFLSSKIKSKFFSNLVLALSSVFLLLGFLEFVFYFLVNFTLPANAYSYKEKSDSDQLPFTRYDKDFGYRAAASHAFEKTMFFNGKEAMRCQYSVDSLSRRVTPAFYKNPADKKYAFFFGCSFTYGFMLNDDQSIPAALAKADTNFHSYNYALNGYGTQQLLSTLKMKNIRREIPEKEGVFIYPFIDHHVRRVIGDQYVMANFDWAKERPYYVLENDTLLLKGDFSARPLTNFIYRLLHKSYMLEYFGISFPLSAEEEGIALTAKIIDEAYKEYKSKFGNDNFYVLIFPGQKIAIGAYLKEKNIKVLDYSKLYDIENPLYHIPGDHHPSSKACEIIAKKLAHDID